jgi:prephenate dehydratase
VELRDRHAAAIASEAAAHYYGAQILQAGIEDNPENYTRFFLVRRTARRRCRSRNRTRSAWRFPSRIVPDRWLRRS